MAQVGFILRIPGDQLRRDPHLSYVGHGKAHFLSQSARHPLLHQALVTRVLELHEVIASILTLAAERAAHAVAFRRAVVDGDDFDGVDHGCLNHGWHGWDDGVFSGITHSLSFRGHFPALVRRLVFDGVADLPARIRSSRAEAGSYS
ncbi:MAG: hypothetical protein EAZ84_03390 [Verrucomicrobia bacterium]|nr:MAG: hypothetical protein EAZ84_03390 [Verrucomicrobiota bacterium]TAE87265.1 MAG: hypothetical protein EAZ82_08480 [Verrucomicrobiota bacterium]TAF25100.1 MAG: hypothetical protein EAZ71_08705 [Verrucomicrobiota bacterium]